MIDGQVKELDQAGLGKLKEMENKLGCCIVALQKRPALATLSKKQLEELQTAEKQMDAVLIAYRC